MVFSNFFLALLYGNRLIHAKWTFVHRSILWWTQYLYCELFPFMNIMVILIWLICVVMLWSCNGGNQLPQVRICLPVGSSLKKKFKACNVVLPLLLFWGPFDFAWCTFRAQLTLSDDWGCLCNNSQEESVLYLRNVVFRFDGKLSTGFIWDALWYHKFSFL